MTVTINSPVFNSATGTGRITQALVDVMNSSATFVKLFDSISNQNPAVSISIGTAGGGTSYLRGVVIIDPNDFTTYIDSPQQLVARIAHELAHAADAIRAADIAGADGLTPGPTSSSNLSPADYNLGRAKDEGFALYQEFLIAKDLELTMFSADPGVPGNGVPGLFAQMNASYNALNSSGQPSAVIAQVLRLSSVSGGILRARKLY